MPYDGLPPSTLLDYDTHRRKNYPYVFYCPSCNRSYLAREKEEKCKFCLGPLKIVTGIRINVYFCEHCDQRIETEEIKMACSTCGSQLKTLYRWDMLPVRERRRIKLARFFGSWHIPKIEVKIPEKTQGKKEKKTIFMKPRKKERTYDEELPTDEIGEKL